MNKKNLLVPFVLGAIALGSCTDDNYDLSNIDDTARFEVKDYVLPVNVKPIKLSKVIDINEDDNGQIKSVVDPVTGKKGYAVLETGTFTSDPIDIPGFSIDNININPINSQLSLVEVNKAIREAFDAEVKAQVDAEIQNQMAILESNPEIVALKTLNPALYEQYKQQAIEEATRVANEYVADHKKELEKKAFDGVVASSMNGEIAQYPISSDSRVIEQTTNEVPNAVVRIDQIGVDFSFVVTLSINDEAFTNVVKNIHIKNLKIKMPAGLTAEPSAGTYYPDGILDLSGVDVVVGKQGYKLTVNVSGIKADKAGLQVVAGKGKDKGSFTYKGEFKVQEGHVSVTGADFVGDHTFFDLPSQLNYSCVPVMSNIVVESFTGQIHYDIDQVNVDPVTLNDLPDFLNDYDTQIFLDNPQIYLAVNNPLYKYALKAEAGLKITPQKRGELRSAKEASIEMVADRKDNVICLSPVDPGAGKYYDNMAVTHHEPYVGLREVVAVVPADGTIKNGGVPDQINVELVDPQVPTQSVNQFKLGETLDPVVGNYTFYAPLAFADGTLIMYKDSDNGWGDDDKTLEKITITKLELNAKATSEIPLEAKLTVKVLDKNGNEIKGVSFSDVHVNANAKGQDISFRLLNGEIKNLDGIEFHATVLANDGKSIEPEQTIKFDNVKVVVSGYYTDEF